MMLARIHLCSLFAFSLVVSSGAFVSRGGIVAQAAARVDHQSSPRLFSTMPSTKETVLDDALLDQVLEVAMDASRKAGEIIIGNAGGAEVSERKANSRDLLTLIDPLCEKIIKETVLETFTSHDFLGEEDVAPGKEASAAALDAKLSSSADDWLWIVDPIDGTTVSTSFPSRTSESVHRIKAYPLFLLSCL